MLTLLLISSLCSDVMGCTSQCVNPKLLLDSSSSGRTGAGRSPPPLPPACPSSRARRCVYSPNYRGGAGWQASHHRFPAGLWLGTLQTPAAVSQMWQRCPTVTGEPSLAKPKGPKRDIKDMRGIGRVGTDRGYAWEVRVESWGHRQSVIQSKVGFGKGTNTDLHSHTLTHIQNITLTLIELYVPNYRSKQRSH